MTDLSETKSCAAIVGPGITKCSNPVTPGSILCTQHGSGPSFSGIIQLPTSSEAKSCTFPVGFAGTLCGNPLAFGSPMCQQHTVPQSYAPFRPAGLPTVGGCQTINKSGSKRGQICGGKLWKHHNTCNIHTPKAGIPLPQFQAPSNAAKCAWKPYQCHTPVRDASTIFCSYHACGVPGCQKTSVMNQACEDHETNYQYMNHYPEILCSCGAPTWDRAGMCFSATFQSQVTVEMKNLCTYKYGTHSCTAEAQADSKMCLHHNTRCVFQDAKGLPCPRKREGSGKYCDLHPDGNVKCMIYTCKRVTVVEEKSDGILLWFCPNCQFEAQIDAAEDDRKRHIARDKAKMKTDAMRDNLCVHEIDEENLCLRKVLRGVNVCKKHMPLAPQLPGMVATEYKEDAKYVEFPPQPLTWSQIISLTAELPYQEVTVKTVPFFHPIKVMSKSGHVSVCDIIEAVQRKFHKPMTIDVKGHPGCLVRFKNDKHARCEGPRQYDGLYCEEHQGFKNGRCGYKFTRGPRRERCCLNRVDEGYLCKEHDRQARNPNLMPANRELAKDHQITTTLAERLGIRDLISHISVCDSQVFVHFAAWTNDYKESTESRITLHVQANNKEWKQKIKLTKHVFNGNTKQILRVPTIDRDVELQSGSVSMFQVLRTLAGLLVEEVDDPRDVEEHDCAFEGKGGGRCNGEYFLTTMIGKKACQYHASHDDKLFTGSKKEGVKVTVREMLEKNRIKGMRGIRVVDDKLLVALDN